MALRFDRGFWIIVFSMTMFWCLMSGDALVGCWRDQVLFRFFPRTSSTGDGDRLSGRAPAGVAGSGSGCMATEAEDALTR